MPMLVPLSEWLGGRMIELSALRLRGEGGRASVWCDAKRQPAWLMGSIVIEPP
jgi:hypothetical protein